VVPFATERPLHLSHELKEKAVLVLLRLRLDSKVHAALLHFHRQ